MNVDQELLRTVLRKAIFMFGKDEALLWIHQPNRHLFGKTPLEVMQENQFNSVLELLEPRFF